LISNDFIDDNITAYDNGGNRWDGTILPAGLLGLIQSISGPIISETHYSDYDEPKEGCIDANNDGFCDSPRNITARLSIDNRPVVHQIYDETLRFSFRSMIRAPRWQGFGRVHWLYSRLYFGYALRLKRTQDFIQEAKNEVLPNLKEFDRGALGAITRPSWFKLNEFLKLL